MIEFKKISEDYSFLVDERYNCALSQLDNLKKIDSLKEAIGKIELAVRHDILDDSSLKNEARRKTAKEEWLLADEEYVSLLKKIKYLEFKNKELSIYIDKYRYKLKGLELMIQELSITNE